ncbi:unnamed protein product, partial [Prorocentrum cordatum]
MCCISLVPEIFGDTVHPARPRCCRRRRWSGLAGDRQEWPAMASRWPAISPYEPPSAACAWAMDHLNDARSRRRGLVHRDPSMRRRQGLRARGGDGRGQHALVLLQAPARRRAGHNSKHKRTHMHRHTLFLVSGRGRARRRRVRTKRATQRLIRHRKRRKKQAEQRARRRLSAAEASGGWRRDTVTEEDADGDGRRRREPTFRPARMWHASANWSRRARRDSARTALPAAADRSTSAAEAAAPRWPGESRVRLRPWSRPLDALGRLAECGGGGGGGGATGRPAAAPSALQGPRLCSEPRRGWAGPAPTFGAAWGPAG